jgi:hypothetical protein
MTACRSGLKALLCFLDTHCTKRKAYQLLSREEVVSVRQFVLSVKGAASPDKDVATTGRCCSQKISI